MATTDQYSVFRDPSKQFPEYFNEGPGDPVVVVSGSTGIDTSTFDPFRQGVELTQLKYYDQGIVKIWSGEPGHALYVSHYGDSEIQQENSAFADKDNFDPLTFVEAQSVDSALFYNIVTYPIVTRDSSQTDSTYVNGIIEPLTIRAKISGNSIDFPFEAHEVRGALQSGNEDSVFSSEQLLSVDYFDLSPAAPFLDMVDMIGPLSTLGYFNNDIPSRLPFSDTRYVRNAVTPDCVVKDMTAALSLMTGSTDNYVPFNKVSATSGFVYDSVQGIGTDSLAFGGMTY